MKKTTTFRMTSYRLLSFSVENTNNSVLLLNPHQFDGFVSGGSFNFLDMFLGAGTREIEHRQGGLQNTSRKQEKSKM